MIQIKVIHRLLGGHVHADVFQGQGEGFTWEKNGELIFDRKGFDAFRSRLSHWVFEDKTPEDDRPGPNDGAIGMFP